MNNFTSLNLMPLLLLLCLISGTQDNNEKPKGDKQLEEIDNALQKGLKWLAEQQNEDGSFGPRRDKDPWKPVSGKRGVSWIDSFCTWIFTVNKDEKTAKKGLDHVKSGKFNPKEAGHGGTDKFAIMYYAYGIGMLYQQSKSEELLPLLKDAVKKIIDEQKKMGGWNYSAKTDNTQNTVMTGTAVCALAVAKNVGVELDGEILQKGLGALEQAYDKESGGFRYGATGEGGKEKPDFKRKPNVARTSAALSALFMCEKYNKDVASSSIDFLKKQFEGKPYFDYHGEPDQKSGLPFHSVMPLGYFHASIAIALADDKVRSEIYKKMTEHLLKLQKEDGSFELGDEFTSKVGGDWRKKPASVRDTCFALFALTLVKANGDILKK